jgi:hypothetical protein
MLLLPARSAVRATLLFPRTVETVSKFVKRGGDCDLHIGLYPPLTLASMDGLHEMCKLLLSGGAVGVRLLLDRPAHASAWHPRPSHLCVFCDANHTAHNVCPHLRVACVKV